MVIGSSEASRRSRARESASPIVENGLPADPLPSCAFAFTKRSSEPSVGGRAAPAGAGIPATTIIVTRTLRPSNNLFFIIINFKGISLPLKKNLHFLKYITPPLTTYKILYFRRITKFSLRRAGGAIGTFQQFLTFERKFGPERL